MKRMKPSKLSSETTRYNFAVGFCLAGWFWGLGRVVGLHQGVLRTYCWVCAGIVSSVGHKCLTCSTLFSILNFSFQSSVALLIGYDNFLQTLFMGPFKSFFIHNSLKQYKIFVNHFILKYFHYSRNCFCSLLTYFGDKCY